MYENAAAAFVKARTPAFAAEYKAALRAAPSPFTDDVFTMAPPGGSCANISRISCCIESQTLFRFSAMAQTLPAATST